MYFLFHSNKRKILLTDDQDETDINDEVPTDIFIIYITFFVYIHYIIPSSKLKARRNSI